MTLKDLSLFFNKPGVWPGFLGGIAVPLSIFCVMYLPPPLRIEELHISARQMVCLFLSMPPLGALCSYGVATRARRRHFIAGITAPGLVISVLLLFNLGKKLEIAKLEQNVLAEDSATKQEIFDGLTESNRVEGNAVIQELQNGTDPL